MRIGRSPWKALALLLGVTAAACGPQDQVGPPSGQWVQIAAGARHSCGLQDDGRVYCWGANDRGQLGDGSGVEQSRPVAVSLTEAAVQVAVGADHACALLTSGALVCWGAGTYGQLGNAGTEDRMLPDVVRDIGDVRALALGHRNSCAVRGDGTVACWGANDYGQLGRGDGAGPDQCEGDPPLPCAVTPEPVAELWDATGITVGGEQEGAQGRAHACAQTASGRAHCWGANDEGQLGDTTRVNRNRPVEVYSLFDVRSLAAGAAHTCAVLGDGSLYCWGRGYGDPRYLPDPPEPLGVECGLDFTCVYVPDGGLECMGDNSHGQLGDGGNTSHQLAEPVLGLGAVVQASAGRVHACAVNDVGEAYCWGSNASGQLGGGDLLESWSPVLVGE